MPNFANKSLLSLVIERLFLKKQIFDSSSHQRGF